MICVYPADCTDFSTNGNGTLAPLSAEVTETLNGEYELTLVHPIDEAGKWQRLVEGCILRAPVPAAMTPRVNFTAPGDDNRTEVWRVNTDFSGAETRKGTLRLRSGPGTKYKVLATYKNGSFVQEQKPGLYNPKPCLATDILDRRRLMKRLTHYHSTVPIQRRLPQMASLPKPHVNGSRNWKTPVIRSSCGMVSSCGK